MKQNIKSSVRSKTGRERLAGAGAVGLVTAGLVVGAVGAAQQAHADESPYVTVVWAFPGYPSLDAPQPFIAASGGVNLSAFDSLIGTAPHCGTALQVDVYHRAVDGTPWESLIEDGQLNTSHDGGFLAYDALSTPYRVITPEENACQVSTATPTPTSSATAAATPTSAPPATSAPEPSSTPTAPPTSQPTPEHSETPSATPATPTCAQPGMANMSQGCGEQPAGEPSIVPLPSIAPTPGQTTTPSAGTVPAATTTRSVSSSRTGQASSTAVTPSATELASTGAPGWVRWVFVAACALIAGGGAILIRQAVRRPGPRRKGVDL